MKKEHIKEKIDENHNKVPFRGKSTNMITAAFMIFIFPIIAIFLGIFIGGYVGKFIEAPIKVSQTIGGIIAFILSGIIIKLADKYFKTDENTEKIHWEDL